MRNDLGASQKEIEFTNGTVSPLSCADDDGDDEEEEEEEEEEEPNKEEEEEEEDEEPVRTAGSQSVPRPESGGSVSSKYQ